MSANGTASVGGLRARRLAAGLTQQQVAAGASCSLSYIRLLERGFVPVESDVLPRVLRLLNDEDPAGTQGPRHDSGVRSRPRDAV